MARCSCNPDYLMQCGCCCFLLSLWGAIQLSVMGWLYYFESSPLVLDVYPTDYTYYTEFILLTKLNYYKTALNCCYAVIIYCFTGIVSIVCMVVAKHKKARAVKDADDDDAFCGIPEEERQPKSEKPEKPLELKSLPDPKKLPEPGKTLKKKTSSKKILHGKQASKTRH